MLTVWKFPLAVDDKQTIQVPLGARILHVAAQNGVPCLWVLVDTDAQVTERTILTRGTGHPVPPTNTNHLGTYMLHDGQFVGHVFEAAPLRCL